MYVLFWLQLQTGALVVSLLVFPTICVAHGSQISKALGRLREHEDHVCAALIHLAASNPYTLPAASIPGSLQLEPPWASAAAASGSVSAAMARQAQELNAWMDSSAAGAGARLTLADSSLRTRADAGSPDVVAAAAAAAAAVRAGGADAVSALADLPGGADAGHGAGDAAAAARRWSPGAPAATLSDQRRASTGIEAVWEQLGGVAAAAAPPRPESAQLRAALQELVGNDMTRGAMVEEGGAGWRESQRRVGMEGWNAQQGGGARSGLWARLEELLSDTGRTDASPATPRMANLLEDVRLRDQHTNATLVRADPAPPAACCAIIGNTGVAQ